tara:strand:- start:4457 stop:4969 length:513 start_codon:yes stop_codon:yes gene_type:complete
MKIVKKREVLNNTAPHTAAHLFLKNIDLEQETIFGLYWPILYELDTRPLIKVLSEMNFKLALPIIKDGEMSFKKWMINEPLFYNSHNFYSPLAKSSYTNPNILIVPLLAFDSQGYRLGYGRGYYDKFYSKNKQLKYYGYGYNAQYIISLPNDSHDLKLKHVITEKKIYAF